MKLSMSSSTIVIVKLSSFGLEESRILCTCLTYIRPLSLRIPRPVAELEPLSPDRIDDAEENMPRNPVRFSSDIHIRASWKR